MKIHWVDPETQEPLEERDGALWNPRSGAQLAPIERGIPRFVRPQEDYAESFGWQWQHWQNERSDARGSQLGLRALLMERTRFDRLDLEGATLLECGMGGGDDTEILLDLPFAEVHSFDLSTAVDRAARHIRDERLTLSQASILRIPYPDRAFDVVYCHRVLQHTPDPVQSLRAICAKVRPGGLLFAHAYRRTWKRMLEWRYKYRWLTKRMPGRWIHRFVERWGPGLHRLNRTLYRNRLSAGLAYNFVPFYHKVGEMDDAQRLELEKLITFDALTPHHDHPMSDAEFFGTLRQEGFQVLFEERTRDAVWCTARCLPE